MMDWEKLNNAIDKAIEERDKLVIHELEKKKQQVEWLLKEIDNSYGCVEHKKDGGDDGLRSR